ncbi:hypothetical protein GQ457_17G003630 [Hibiscus cannabinus]
MVWNSEVFRYIWKRKANLLAHIRGVEKALENSTANHLVKLEARLKVELDTVLSQEKSLWPQISRVNWIENGDHNTKYFYMATVVLRRNNMINRLKLQDGSWCMNHEIMK